MRTRAGKLIADLNDKIGAEASASLPFGERSSIDENQTVYRLFPYELNDTPIFTTNVFDASTPRIVSDLSYSPAKANVMYRDENNTVRALIGTSFVFRVAAQQPNILNVENGIPLIFQPNENLIYTWFRDGETVFDFELELESDISPRKDSLTTTENELVFTNATPRMSGQYVCIVANDIGESSSETINLEIRNPNDPEDTFFKQNVIQNGFAKDSTNEWTVAIGDVTTGKFVNEAVDLELKKPSTGLFGHSVGEVYPHPINIRFNGIKNYRIASLIDKDAQYFTRVSIDHTVNGGTRQAVFYQDVDLTEISDYISGRVYGCNGVRAYFGSIIGNALTRFIPTLDLVAPNLRYKIESYYSSKPRISYENYTLTGYGLCDEKVTITIQEYEGATPLPSVIYKNGKSEVVDSIQLTDTLSSLRDQFDLFNEIIPPPTTEVFTTVDGLQIALKPLTSTTFPNQAARYLNIYKTLYDNKPERYYTYGQYADYQDAIMRVLNPSTNKIRVSIKFEHKGWSQQNEYSPRWTSDGVLQMQPWEKPMLKLLNRQHSEDVWAVINNSTYAELEKPYSTIVQTVAPHAMVTGLGLILEPLTATSIGAANFRNQIATIVPKELEERPTTTNVLAKTFTPFKQIAETTTGLGLIISFNPSTAFWFIRKYEDTLSDFGIFNYNFDNDTQDKDDEYLNGNMIVENITTGGTLVSSNFHAKEQVKYEQDKETFTDYGEKQLTGLQTIRITIEAQGTTSGENGNQDDPRRSSFPYLLLTLINTTDILTPDPAERRVVAFPNRNLTSDPQFLNHFLVGNTTGDVIDQKAADLTYIKISQRVRKLIIEIPSNCLKHVVGGIRNHNNEPDTGGVFFSKFDFTGPNGELQYSGNNIT